MSSTIGSLTSPKGGLITNIISQVLIIEFWRTTKPLKALRK
jgi:hypothetical protein